MISVVVYPSSESELPKVAWIGHPQEDGITQYLPRDKAGPCADLPKLLRGYKPQHPVLNGFVARVLGLAEDHPDGTYVVRYGVGS